LLFDLQTNLRRPERFDVLSALIAATVSDDGSLDDLELFDELTTVLRETLEAPAGQLVETLRRRMVEVGEALDLLRYAGFEPVEIHSWDQVTDRQLIWAIGERLLQEINATLQADDDTLAEDLGRRLLAHPGPARHRMMLRIGAIPDLSGVKRAYGARRGEIERVVAGDTASVGLDDRGEHLSRSLVVGTWVCDCLSTLCEIIDSRRQKGVSVPDRTVYLTAPAAGELLATWLLSHDLSAAGDRPSAPGFKGTSSRTRARKARSARVAATLAVSAHAYMQAPEPPFGHTSLDLMPSVLPSVSPGEG